MDISWLTSPLSPSLGRADLHLWLIPCGPGDDSGLDQGEITPEEPITLSVLWPLLSRTEQERARRLRLFHHRQAYLCAHAGLRLILAQYLEQPPERICFIRGPQGKPAVAGPVEFNLTTSGDLALVAVRLGHPVGVDCERINPHRDMVAIARRLFAASEIEQLQACDTLERPRLFTRFWTALEARVKLNGCGLFHPPLVATGEPEIRHFIPQPGYIAAIASLDLPPLNTWQTHRLSLPDSARG
ncbi:MAG: 4'-phosphopantetheinyl transferase superfamily protein [Gammaproteobacteria bacterium]|jgi:4'-phosphopantetheinyl transferase|nr:4'-phosphopantetheinyl transferase superfamily protein [Gammaproteobacteria bacterium]